MSSRSSRNTLLAGAAASGVVAAVLLLVSTGLTFSDYLSFPGELAELKVSAGLDVLEWALALAAFGTALAAFLLTSRNARTKALAAAAGLFVGQGLAELAGDLMRVIFGASHSQSWQFLASQSAGAAAGAALAVAALLVALGIRATRPDGRLGAAAVSLAGSYALLCAAYGFELAGFLHLPFTLPARFSSGLGTIAAGHFAVAVGAVVAGVAFFTSDGLRRRGEVWQAQREGSLGAAASIIAVGFLGAGIGLMLLSSSQGGTGRNKAEEWLQAVGQLLLALAAVCGGVGFFRSRRDADRRAAELPVPAPAA
ncbi:MAG TPA: hypothetical protein VFU33_00175 [Gaiellaceae bacterium]|nr:hypothetical protein [Gaiellaceae bacterium]